MDVGVAFMQASRSTCRMYRCHREMLFLRTGKHSGSRELHQERFVACEVWSRRLLLTADYKLVLPKKSTLQRGLVLNVLLYMPVLRYR